MFNTPQRIVIFVFLAVGVPFVGAGILVYRLAPLSDIAADRVEKLTPANSNILSDTSPGSEVLVEGHVSRTNPTQLRSFMAYIREEYEPDSDPGDDDNDSRWIERERVMPPLLLELSGGGPVQVENSDYVLTQPNILNDGNNIRYRALEANDPVVSVGVLASNAEPPQITAEFVAFGTKADYVVAQRNEAASTRLLGIIFMTLGGLFIVISLGVGIYTWQRG